ncbi:MAG: TlpA family protein disulfide reductase [Lachnospiraceae bacterium]|nr:TlpA family protein disulfide reductase [Lachnospiraceae bacterium]
MKKKHISASIAIAIALMLTGCGAAMVQDPAENPKQEASVIEDSLQEDSQESTEDTGSVADASDEQETEPEASQDTGSSEETVKAEEAEIMDMMVADLDKNDVRLGDVVSKNKVTMINFWGTFCGPCINEMPDLAEIEKAYKDKGFEIIGMTVDIIDGSGNIQDEVIDDALAIADETGVEYPLLIGSEELMAYENITAVPTTFFVDSSGNLLMPPLVGSRPYSEWDKVINEALSKAE